MSFQGEHQVNSTKKLKNAVTFLFIYYKQNFLKERSLAF